MDSGAVALEAAGSLRGGRRVWILARVSEAVREVVPGDPVQQYVLLAHAHDGSLSVRVGFTVVRVVCNNTLQAALDQGASKLIKVHHTKHTLAALERIREIVDLARAEFCATTEQLSELAREGAAMGRHDRPLRA